MSLETLGFPAFGYGLLEALPALRTISDLGAFAIAIRNGGFSSLPVSTSMCSASEAQGCKVDVYQDRDAFLCDCPTLQDFPHL